MRTYTGKGVTLGTMPATPATMIAARFKHSPPPQILQLPLVKQHWQLRQLMPVTAAAPASMASDIHSHNCKSRFDTSSYRLNTEPYQLQWRIRLRAALPIPPAPAASTAATAALPATAATMTATPAIMTAAPATITATEATSMPATINTRTATVTTTLTTRTATMTGTPASMTILQLRCQHK